MVQHPAVRAPIAISLGAIAGALSRYYIGGWLQGWSNGFPVGTLVVNVTGCFVLGLLAVLSVGRTVMLPPDARLLLATGFLGSYTTFSSYELDTAHLLRDRSLPLAVLYWAGSAVLGLLAVHLGTISMEQLLHWLKRDRQNPG